jgi:hypothetical protein
MTRKLKTSGLFEELDYRENDGITISLLWSRADNSLSVFVVDAKTEEQFELRVEACEAIDAFRHPFAYAVNDRLASLPSRV